MTPQQPPDQWQTVFERADPAPKEVTVYLGENTRVRRIKGLLIVERKVKP